MRKELTKEAHANAVKVLGSCAKPQGFFASGLPGGYEAVWARDSMIASLGASLVDKRFKKPFARSLELLAKHQSEHGQIPNAVGSYNTERRSDVTYNSIDSTLWYLIGHFVYRSAYKEQKMTRKHRKNIEAAFNWLAYQDPNEDKLLVQQPTMDWQDAFPHKYGRTINTLSLYFSVLKMYGKVKLAKRIQNVVNGKIEKYLSLYDKKKGYYLPWIWKSHDGEREEGYWFDTLGNLLAIVSGLATPAIAKNILRYIDRSKINRPYPCKAIWPPIKKASKEWHSYFSLSDAKNPLEYLNAGIWPFIGGFYITALVKARQFAKAEHELELLISANKLGISQEWEFNEWLHGKTGKPAGTPYQAWSAGMFIFASQCVRRNRVPYFK